MLLTMGIVILFFLILALAADAINRDTSDYPKISFDEFMTIYNAYEKAGKPINLYSEVTDVCFGTGGKEYHLYLNTWKDRIKFHQYRKTLEKQWTNEHKKRILAEIRKEIGSTPEVPADVYEAILNDLRKKYGV